MALEPCCICGKVPKVTYPDVDGGATLAHPKDKECPHSGELWLFRDADMAADTWNRTMREADGKRGAEWRELWR